jgi:uncharacterized protein involved in type VI secretion and phage assembly
MGIMAEGGHKYYGKYRGTVVNNIDPMQMGRVQVQVAEVVGLIPGTWAMPCVPIAGKQEGVFMVPQIGSGVWVEFEHGDPGKPIWVGGFWGTPAEVPALALAPQAPPPGQNIVIQTTGQNTVLLSDVPGPFGGIILKSLTGAMLIVNDTGIYLSNGKGASLFMVGPTVTINNGALIVT